MNRTALEVWQALSPRPGGKWLFSRLVCFKAPYFSTIRPIFEQLEPEHCVVRMRKSRSVLNHIGTVHAIAMCNVAELAGGTMTDVTVPSTHRWIPKSMAVEYLKKASTDLIAVATPDSTNDWSSSGEYKVNVDVHDQHAESVFKAQITMWVSPKRDRSVSV